MSNPRSKAESSKSKDLRQGIAEQANPFQYSHPVKKSRPWKVLSTMPRLKSPYGENVFCAHHSPTREAAEAWIAKEARGGILQAEDFWIVGPDDADGEGCRYLSLDGHDWLRGAAY